MKVEGKIAIVTGGAQGLGRAYAEVLLDKGAKVMIADILDKQGQDTMKELQAKYGEDTCKFVRLDVSCEDQVTEMFRVTGEQLGTPNIIINNAGIGDEHNWRKLIDVNLTGAIQIIWDGMDMMSHKNGKPGGVIVNTASAGAFMSVSHVPVYCATKAGIMQMTRSVGTKVFYEKHGVRVNCICPGGIDTQMTTIEYIRQSSSYDLDNVLALVDSYPKMKPSDVASAAMRLIEDDTLNGEAMLITSSAGASLHQFENIDL